jgi:hypothetical protein
MIEKECSIIRQHLEELTYRQARVTAEQFTITLPNFDDIEQAYSPTVMYHYDPTVISSENYLKLSIRNRN